MGLFVIKGEVFGSLLSLDMAVDILFVSREGVGTGVCPGFPLYLLLNKK